MDATVTFSRLVQDSQDFGSNDDHMVSRVFFSLQVGDNQHSDLYADIKQTVGSSIDDDSIEVSHPIGYSGPFNHGKFCEAAKRYFRSLVGRSGEWLHIAGEVTNIRMRNNTFAKIESVTFPVDPDNKAW